MKRIDVIKQGDGWIGRAGDRTVVTAGTKDEAVRKAAAAARSDDQPVSVRIHTMDGRFQQERTYPRGADPRRSHG
jgi:hypothetical protein